MDEKYNKASPKSFIRKSEIMDNSIKSRSFSKGGASGNKIKTEMPHNSKISAGLLASDAAPKTYLAKCFEDQQVKLKLLELTPRNPAMETSEGVQEFIKQVSNFIEKKNPFKDKVMHSFGKIDGTIGPIDPIKFNTTNENLQNNQIFDVLRQAAFDGNDEIKSDDDQNYLEKLKWEKRNSVISFKKNLERIPQGKKNRSGISVRKKDENDKRNQKELPLKNKKSVEVKRVITLNENPIFLYENERRNHVTHVNDKKNGETSTNKQSPTKRKKRSEIPLRKNRKPVSTQSQKPLENIESNFSINLFPNKKPFSPIEELGLCSEIQVIISAGGSSEKLSESGKASDYESDKKKNSEECCFGNIRLSNCFKSLDTTSDLSPPSAKLSDDLSSPDKKVKVLDLEKVKTASFTVLRSNTNVFNRLESLHKRNISTKEEKIAAKTMSKLKILSSKNSFGSLKGKNSKKNLSFRLNSKRIKPNAKLKGKKNKKETEETFHLPKKHSGTKNKSNLDICSEILATGNVCLISRTYGYDNPKNENFRANQNKERTDKGNDSNIPITIRKVASKSIPRRTGIQKEKEELKTYSSPPHISPKTNTENFPKYEKLEPMKNSTLIKKLEKANQRNGKPEDKKNELTFGLKFHKTTPRTPPPTPDIGHSISVTNDFEDIQIEDDESSSRTIILDNKFNQENNSSWCSSEAKTRKKPVKTKSNIEKMECKSKENAESTKIKKLGLVIKGRSLNFKKDEPPEKPESSDSSKIKLQLKINFNSPDHQTKTPKDSTRSPETFDWLFTNYKKCNGELLCQTTNWNNLANEEIKESNFKRNYNTSESTASELTDEKVRNITFDSVFLKPRKYCPSLKRKNQYKTSSISIKEMRKKKIRSNTEDRRLSSSSSFFNSNLTLQNNLKVDTKLKGGLREKKQKDLFEDVASIKLRRRNSEPQTFKEFVWRHADFGNYKGIRPSASSLASSLRHLNTDDIDDFIFWEPVPQKMTSCWEMSLYHFKKPWTVLSRSVFEDNRQSKTPGLILENLRKGGNLNIRQFAVSQNEKTNCHEENPFDVEPSIAQKNIDIRNWLAALNFPTPPSTSNDVISEGHFSIQSTSDARNLNKIEICPKRRKILPNIKFSNENSEKEIEREEKYKTSTNWKANEGGHLMELIRRKSGGFVTKEQFLNSGHLVPCPNVTVSFCTYSKAAEEKFEKTKNGNTIMFESEMLKSLEAPLRSSVSLSETIIGTNSVRRNQSVGTDEIKDELSEAKEEKKLWGERYLRLKLNPFASEVRVWKFLFIFTLFIAIVHYSFLRSSEYTLSSFHN